ACCWRRSMIPPRVRLPINLVTSGAQTGDPVAVDVPLPSEKLVNREVVQPTYFLDRDPTSAHSFDDRRLAPDSPPPSQRGQLGYSAEQIVRASSCAGGSAAGFGVMWMSPECAATLAGLS